LPTSRPDHLAWLCNRVLQLQPKSILDIGCGSGAKGVLFREYADIWNGRYDKSMFKTVIDGVEIFGAYVTPLHDYIYDSVLVDDVRELLFTRNYDLIYLGDVIEHMCYEDGVEVIEKLKSVCNYSIIVSTPVIMSNQVDMNGNEYERHIRQWGSDDFPGWDCHIFGNVGCYEWHR
jgi:2-polyprenyl-3-methyl-5-hydroxy-6-metoxy-1,4-benzoquinol methylase